MSIRLLRWVVVVLGGVLLGAGLCLHGQLAVAGLLHGEVGKTSFLWRAVGELTFFLQDDATRAALSMEQIPRDVVRSSDRAAWVLIVTGAATALLAPLLTRIRQRRAPQHH